RRWGRVAGGRPRGSGPSRAVAGLGGRSVRLVDRPHVSDSVVDRAEVLPLPAERLPREEPGALVELAEAVGPALLRSPASHGVPRGPQDPRLAFREGLSTPWCSGWT